MTSDILYRLIMIILGFPLIFLFLLPASPRPKPVEFTLWLFAWVVLYLAIIPLPYGFQTTCCLAGGAWLHVLHRSGKAEFPSWLTTYGFVVYSIFLFLSGYTLLEAWGVK